MGKECCVIIIDVGRSMGSVREGAINGLDKAKKSLRLLIQDKLLWTKKDELGIVLMGTEETANALNEEAPDNYKHISIAHGVGLPELAMLESVDAMEGEDAEADAVDALLVAMDLIISRVKHLKFSKRIFLITDAAGAIDDDEEQMQRIAEKLVEHEFKLNVIGVGFRDEPDSDDDDDDDDGGGGAVEADDRPAQQQKNQKTLTKLAEKVGGAWFSIKSALEMLSVFRTRAVNQVSKMRESLHIGETRIPVYTYAKTMMKNMPSLSKYSIVSEESAAPESMKVKMQRTYWNKQGEQDLEVSAEERVRAYKYGKDMIPFSSEDEKRVKQQVPKGMWLLGFCGASEVPRHQYLSGVDVCVAEPGNTFAGKALSGLIHACHELERVAIVRYVARANSAPKLGVLSPVIKPSVECFYFNQLPFAEDIRHYQFASLSANPLHVPNASQLLAARNLISKMDLMDAGRDEDGDPVQALKPKLTFNPVLQRFYQVVERRALDSTAGIDALDPLIANYVNPPAQLIQDAKPAFNKFKEHFKLERVVEEGKKEKRHWRDYLDADVKLDEDIVSAKRAKVKAEEGADGVDGSSSSSSSHSSSMKMNFEDIVSKTVTSVGSVTPVEDMQSMLADRSQDNVSKALDEMLVVIKKLVTSSFGNTYYNKALDCLKALRTASVQEEESERFNNGLTELRVTFEKAKQEFWKMVSDASLYPIDKTEVADSKYSKEDALKYYGEAVVEVAQSADLSTGPTPDDMFDDLE